MGLFFLESVGDEFCLGNSFGVVEICEINILLERCIIGKVIGECVEVMIDKDVVCFRNWYFCSRCGESGIYYFI